jgi:hypothetical protein
MKELIKLYTATKALRQPKTNTREFDVSDVKQ